MDERTFRPPLWRRVALPLLFAFLAGVLLVEHLVEHHDLHGLFSPQGGLIGVCLMALATTVWLHRSGSMRSERVFFS